MPVIALWHVCVESGCVFCSNRGGTAEISPSASDCRGRFCFTFAGGNRKGFHRIQSRPLLRQIRFQSSRYALEKSHPKEILMKNWKGEINNDRI